jgi:hypothetical protein
MDIVTWLRTIADSIEKNNTDLVFPLLTKGENTPKKKGKQLNQHQIRHIRQIIHKEFF